MKIKKYFAADMRQALNLARQDHGPDVVILGNRKVLGGVELIAAEDYNEAYFVDDGLTCNIRHGAGSLTGRNDNGPAARPVKEARELPEQKAMDGKFWSHEFSLDQVQQEINSLRKLLEQQMSGLAWGEIGRRHPLWAGLLHKLGDLGITPAIAREVVQQIPETYSMEQAWSATLDLLGNRIPVYNDNILSQDTVLAFTGASGTGKTTTIAKLAAQYVLEHNAADIIIATLDAYRVGGREQLSSYARILGIPLRTVHNREDMSELLDQYYGRKLILVDTAGVSPRDTRYRSQLDLIGFSDSPVHICLALSATSQANTLRQVIEAHRALRPQLCVLTKLDEASSLGGVLSVVIDEGLKIAWQCSGQQVPDDIARVTANDLISRSVDMMKRYGDAAEEELIDQDFGKFAVYNTIGEYNGQR